MLEPGSLNPCMITVPGVGHFTPDWRLIVTFEQIAQRQHALIRRRSTVLPDPGLAKLDKVTGELIELLREPEKPPFCNTGVKNVVSPIGSPTSSECPNECLADYLSVSFRGSNALDRACHAFGPGLSWHELGRGGYGYTSCRRRGHVSVYYGGDKALTQTGEETCFVQVSGQGCRQLEAEGVIGGDLLLDHPNLSPWQAFFSELLEDGAVFKRLDFAIDDTEGALDLDLIESYWNNGDVSTHVEILDPRKPTNRQGVATGHTLYFGSRQSLMFVRIYNKKLERLNAGDDVPFEHWVRFEIELKAEKAHKLAEVFVQYGMGVIPSVIRGFMDFKDPDDHNKSDNYRRKSAPWWDKWLDGVSRLRLQVAPKIRSLTKLAEWFEHQMSASLHVLAHAPGYGRQYLERIIKTGGERLSKAHLEYFAPIKGLTYGKIAVRT